MKKSNRGWLALVCAMSMMLVPSCSNKDEALTLPVEQVVAAGLNSALNTTVVPLVSFLGALGTLLAPPAALAPTGIGCPDTSSWCVTGTATCSVVATGLQFDFNSCQAVTGDGPITLGGSIVAVPGAGTIGLTLNALVINNSPAMSGTGLINLAACSYTVNISTADADVFGTVTKCSFDTYPTGNVLSVSFDSFLLAITFNGTSSAPVAATQGGLLVASCTIDLAADPLSSTCYAP